MIDGTVRRIGDADREAAVSQLDEHWHAGRLDPAEHEARVTRARAAVTEPDLHALFVDLPASGRGAQFSPQDSGLGSGQISRESSTPRQWTGAQDHGRPAVNNMRETIMAVIPFVALVLFFTTHTWLWFIMIPVAGTVLFGPSGRRHGGYGGHGHGGDRDRDR